MKSSYFTLVIHAAAAAEMNHFYLQMQMFIVFSENP